MTLEQKEKVIRMTLAQQLRSARRDRALRGTAAFFSTQMEETLLGGGSIESTLSILEGVGVPLRKTAIDLIEAYQLRMSDSEQVLKNIFGGTCG